MLSQGYYRGKHVLSKLANVVLVVGAGFVADTDRGRRTTRCRATR